MTKENTKLDEVKLKAESAMKTLKDGTLRNLATAYLVNNKKELSTAYGSILGDYTYNKYLGNLSKPDSTMAGLMGAGIAQSEANSGVRYGGSVSGGDLISSAMAIIQESLGNMYSKDALSMIGSNVELDKKYSGKTLTELAKSDDKNTKKLSELMSSIYMTNMVNDAAMEAIKETKKATLGGLEETLVKEGFAIAA